MHKLVAVVAVVAGASAGCGGGAPPPAVSPAPTSSSAAPAPPASDAGAGDASTAPDASAPLQPTLEAVPAAATPEPLPHVEIAFPFAEQHISAAKAPGYHLRLKVEHWPARGVELVLDDFRPRPLAELPEKPTLGALVPADRTLEPGEHLLVAMAVRDDGATVKPQSASSLEPFAAVHFWVGPRGASSVDMHQPMLVLSEPRGTFNGSAAADAVRIDFYVMNAALGAGKYRVAASVDGDGVHSELVVDSWQPLAVHGLPSGDFQVTLRLLGPDGQPVVGPRATAARTITVNRDLPAKSRFGHPGP